jgi:hypothetical protein
MIFIMPQIMAKKKFYLVAIQNLIIPGSGGAPFSIYMGGS